MTVGASQPSATPPSTRPDEVVGGEPTAGRVRAAAPGRVNLIGEHTDYTGGLALPMAVQLATTIEGVRGGNRVLLDSDAADGPTDLLVPFDGAPAAVEPPWARYVAAVAAELRSPVGLHGSVRTTLPVGSGLSSSASLELATALALGFSGTRRELAELAQRAEHAASGVPCGIMDQLASACGRRGHALRIDCRSLEVREVPIPDDVEIVVVHSGRPRSLASTAYGERRHACETVEARLGPLRELEVADLAALDDPVLVRRARHVVTENTRVDAFVSALGEGDLDTLGEILAAGHASLRDDFEVSTPDIDALVAELSARPGVFGVRLTGAGFGGCVVALCEPGALGRLGWRVQASDGAGIEHIET